MVRESEEVSSFCRTLAASPSAPVLQEEEPAVVPTGNHEDGNRLRRLGRGRQGAAGAAAADYSTSWFWVA
jgi:hypothetical protein